MSNRLAHAGLDATYLCDNLLIGSAPHPGSRLAAAGVKALALCAREYQLPSRLYPGVQVLHCPLPDDHYRGLTPEQSQAALHVAADVAELVASGTQTLVTCMAGRNRSGIVCAVALAELLGITPAKGGELVRAHRGPFSLTNPKFVDLLNLYDDKTHESCELCQHRRETFCYYEDALCWIVDCKTCQVPMVVLRRHSTTPMPDELTFMLDMLRGFAGLRAELDLERRSIPAHWHAHARLPRQPRHAR